MTTTATEAATTARFALDESAARAFIARALRRYSGTGNLRDATREDIELPPGWNPRTMIYGEIWLTDYLVSEAWQAGVLTGPAEIELVDTPDMEGGMYFWRIPRRGFAVCSLYREEARHLGSGRKGALGALDVLREATEAGNKLLAAHEKASGQDRIAAALGIARTYGRIDGDHHKAWVIEQMTAALEGRPADPGRGIAP